MSRLKLSLACGDYDRTRSLEEGRVRPDGIDLHFVRLSVEETFFRMVRHQEFDVAEMSLSTYVASLERLGAPFVAIPVFTSRMFRHSSVYCHAGAGIVRPQDLVGRVIGTPEIQLTAGVWIRGILAEHHNLPLDSVTYVTGGLEQAGRVEKLAVGGIRSRPAPVGRSLASMLAAGEIDALQSPRAPSSYLAGDARVHRLFRDPTLVEQKYFTTTGIFPIMHVVVLRRDVHERHPWVARTLTTAFEDARRLASARFSDYSALATMSPWSALLAEDERRLFGGDPWTYGLDDANRRVLATFLRYHHEQGLSERIIDVDDLFVSSSIESFVI